jgi:hypothetical protein
LNSQCAALVTKTPPQLSSAACATLGSEHKAIMNVDAETTGNIRMLMARDSR